MQVFIDSGEWYPVLTVEPDGEYNCGTPVEVDKATHERWERVFREFDDVQEELHQQRRSS